MLTATLVAGLATLVYLVVEQNIFVRQAPASPGPNDSVAVTFGFDRSPRTRTATVDLESSPVDGSSEDGLASVRLARDLTLKDGAGQFPADQFAVGISRLTETRSAITITANPWEPERVASGAYSGTLQVRGPNVREDIPVSVWLQSRDGRWAVLAGTLLFAGALLGLVVKWITERLTPQAALVRRLAVLKKAFAYREDGATLPIALRNRVEELEDLIARSDYGRAEKLFDELESDKARLSVVARHFLLLYNQLESLATLVKKADVRPQDRPLLDEVLDSLYLEIQDRQVSADPDAVRELADLRREFATVRAIVTEFIRDGSSSETLRRLLVAVQQGDYADAKAAYERYLADESHGAATTTYVDEHMPSRDSEQIEDDFSADYEAAADRPSFIFRYARAIAGVASIVVVTLAGLKTQYLDSQVFDGSLSSWLTLGLWGLAVELSGVSVLEVIGRLGGGGTTSSLK